MPVATVPTVVVEQSWYERRRTILADASTRLVRAAVIGDSIGAGYYASDFRDKAFTALISDALQDAYGDGGSGWIDSAWEPFVFLPEASGAVTTTGAWTGVTGGPNGGGRRPTVAGNGATVTSPFRGTTLDMVQRRGSGFGQWTYAIDGGAPVAVSAANATADIHTTTVTGLSPGEHTVTQTATTGDCRLFGIRGRNATGVVLDRYCRASAAYVNPTAGLNLLAAAEGLAGQTTLSTTFGMHTGLDLVILSLGVNDALDTEVTTAGLETVLHTLWDRARRLGPDGEPPLFVVMIPHLGKHDDADTSPEYTRVVSTLRNFGAAIGAAVVDVWAEGHRSWDYWNGLGAWGLFFGNPDAIHLSDVGHELMAASTIALLTEPVVAGGWAPDYATVDQLAAYLRIDDDVDDAELAVAITAASRAIDQATNRQFGQVDVAEERTYTARPDYEGGYWVVDVDDYQTADGLAVAVAGETVATFDKAPLNAAPRGHPWTRVAFTADSESYPCTAPYRVTVTARWGWAEVPDTVVQATLLQAARFFTRRNAPFGVAGSPDQGSELRLLARVDPDVAVMLRSYMRPRAVG